MNNRSCVNLCVIGNAFSQNLKLMVKNILKKENRAFYASFVVCLILSSLLFLNAKVLNAFGELGAISWFLIPAVIFGSSLFLLFLSFTCLMTLRITLSEIRNAISERNYWLLFPIIVGFAIFIGIIFPFLELVFDVISLYEFGMKTI